MTALPPPPPNEPAAGRSCDAGWCDEPSVGWRWFSDLRAWLPACDGCMSARHLRHDEPQEASA